MQQRFYTSVVPTILERLQVVREQGAGLRPPLLPCGDRLGEVDTPPKCHILDERASGIKVADGPAVVVVSIAARGVRFSPVRSKSSPQEEEP